MEALAAKSASDQSRGIFADKPGGTTDLKAQFVARCRHPPAAAGRPGSPNASGDGPFHRADVEIAFPFGMTGIDSAAPATIALGGVFSIKALAGIGIDALRLPREFIWASGTAIRHRGHARPDRHACPSADRHHHQAES